MAGRGFGLLGLASFRRTAFVGPKVYPDVVDDTKRNGRAAYLAAVRIDQSKGKAFAANLRGAKRYGEGDYDGAVGGPPAGGTTGRQSYVGSRSTVRIPQGMKHRIRFSPNTTNSY